MQCAVVENISKRTRELNSLNIFVIQKCFGERQPKFYKQLTNIIGNALGPATISQLFCKKYIYKSLYNSVLTNDSDQSTIKETSVFKSCSNSND